MSTARRATRKPRRARGSLSEEEILDAATALIERDGVDGLSMPNLARYLETGVMSMYWYFHSKDELLAGLADRAIREIYAGPPPGGDGSWDEEIVAQAQALHRALRSRSLYLQLCRTRPRSVVLRPDVLEAFAERLEGALQLFRPVGLSTAQTLDFLTVLNACTLGFGMMQLGAEQENNHTAEHAIEGAVAQLSPAKFPTLGAVNDVGGIVSVSDDRYEKCLRLLVTGMKAQIEPSR